jgi:Ca-activated chloride channel family protein
MRTTLASLVPVAFVATLALSSGLPARATPVVADPVDLDAIGAGELLWRSEDGLVPLPLARTDLRIDVTGVVLRARMTQSFSNPLDETIDALYLFPLPEQAAVERVELRIGPRRIRAVVQERDEARQTFERARREGRKAALVEQHRPNLFRLGVANVDPGESVRVELVLVGAVEIKEGGRTLAFPLTFTPRHGGAVPAAAPSPGLVGAAPPVTLAVRIDAGAVPASIASSSHDLRLRWEGEQAVLESRAPLPGDRDLLVSWEPRRDDQPRPVVHLEQQDDADYALVTLLPPRDHTPAAAGAATLTIFVIDVSGSMAGPSLEMARTALLAALERLRPGDGFNVVAFSDAPRLFRAEPAPALAREVGAARRWIEGLEAGGGTEIGTALEAGLAQLTPDSDPRARRLVFLTDGAIAGEEPVLAAVDGRLGSARLHAIGIGSAPNRYLMRAMARRGRGLTLFVASPTRAGEAISRFLERIDRPVLTDLHITVGGVAPLEMFPDPLPDLHAGQPLVATLRLPRGSAGKTLVVEGRLGRGRLREEVVLGPPSAAGAGIAARWARAKVERLSDSLLEGAEREAVRAAVVELGLCFGLVTRYTSMVAVEDVVSADGPARPVQVRAAAPAGWALPRTGTSATLLQLAGGTLTVLGMLLLIGPALVEQRRDRS